MQERLSLEYIEGQQIYEYAETGKIKFSKEVDEIFGVSKGQHSNQIEMSQITPLPSQSMNRHFKNKNDQNTNGFHDHLGQHSFNPMHHEISNGQNSQKSQHSQSNGNSKRVNEHNGNGRSHDFGAMFSFTSNEREQNASPNGQHPVNPQKPTKAPPIGMMQASSSSSSSYSDEDDISKLSSLQYKIDQRIVAEEAELEEEEEDYDIDSSSIESADPYQPTETPAIDLNSSIKYSLSTTFIGTPRDNAPHHIKTHSQHSNRDSNRESNRTPTNPKSAFERNFDEMKELQEDDDLQDSNTTKFHRERNQREVPSRIRVQEMDVDQFVDLICEYVDDLEVDMFDRVTLRSTMHQCAYSGTHFVQTLNAPNHGITFTKSIQRSNIRLGVAMELYKRIKRRVEEDEQSLKIETEQTQQSGTFEQSVSTFHDEKFSVISLIATCKFVAQKAGSAITDIYHTVDLFDNVKYDEKRSFEEIDRHWIDNRKKLAMAHQASERGMKSMKRKKKRKRTTGSDTASLASSDGGNGNAPSSPFKQKLPAYIKETELFRMKPSVAAMSLSNAIISDSIKAHFPELNGIKYPKEARKLDRTVNLPQWIDIDGAKRRKLRDENGNDIERELRRREPLKLESFRNLEEENLVVWVQPMEGIQAMTKRDRESQRSVTVLIGISDVDTKRPIAGIIHRPFTKETVIGIPSLGVWPFDFRVINMKTKSKSKRVVINRYNHGDVVKKYLKKVKYDQLALEGGLGNNVLLLMENEADAVLHPDHERTHKWDTCAIEAVILALGGDFTQTNGKQYEYRGVTNRLKKGFIATLHGTKYHHQYQYDLYFA